MFRQDIRDAILKFLKDNGEKATGEVQQALGRMGFKMDSRRIRHYLQMLVVEGKVLRRKPSPRVCLWRLKE